MFINKNININHAYKLNLSMSIDITFIVKRYAYTLEATGPT
jgi:hypothetical protein